MRVVLLEPGQADGPDPGRRLLAGRVFACAPIDRTQGDVVDDVLPRQDRVLLEHIAHPRGDIGYVLAAYQDTAGRWRFKAGHEGQGGRLTASCGADDRDKFPGADVDVQVSDRGVDTVTPIGGEPFGCALKFDEWKRHCLLLR